MVYIKRKQLYRLKVAAGGLVLGLLILGVLSNTYIRPSSIFTSPLPWALVQLMEYNELREERPLVVALGYSTWRFCLISIGMTIVGVPLGMLVAVLPKVRVLVAPIVRWLSSPPLLMLLFLLPLVFRGDEETTLCSLSLVMGISLVSQIQQAVQAVPQVYIHSAHTLGADTWEVARWTIWPLAKRHILLAMARVASFSWGYVAVVEYVTSERGLGELIYSARQSAQMAYVWVSLSVVLGLSFVTYIVTHTLVVYMYPEEVTGE